MNCWCVSQHRWTLKACTKWKKSVIKVYTLPAFINMTVQSRKLYRDSWYISGCLGRRRGWWWGWRSFSHSLWLCDPVDCSLPGSSDHGISQARILGWLPFPSLGIFLTQGSNPSLLHCRRTLHHLSQQKCSIYTHSKGSCSNVLATLLYECDF